MAKAPYQGTSQSVFAPRKKRASQIGVVDRVPIRFFEAGETFVTGDAGIVDENVDAIKTIEIGSH